MALAASEAMFRRESGDIEELPVAAAATLYQNSMCCCDANGRLVVASATAGLSPVRGVCIAEADNSGGGAGAINGRIRNGIFRVDASGTITIANRGDLCYAVDDEQVALSNAGNRPLAGEIVDVDANGVWVKFDTAANAAAQAGGSDVSGALLYQVRGASTANIAALATAAVTIDGVTYVEGERILLKDQATASENGIYVYGTVAGTAPLTRALDADGADEVAAGMMVQVAEGTAHGDSKFVLTTNDPIVVGTTNLTFTEVAQQFGVAGTLVDVDTGVGTAAAGTSDTVARADHVHPFVVNTGTNAGQPAAATAGLLYHKTDVSPGLFYDTGAAWEQVSLKVGSRTATITSADLTTAGVGPETENIGAVLPSANCIILGYRINLTDAFDNGAGVSLAMELGDSDVDSLEDGYDCFTGSTKEGVGFSYTTPGPGIGVPALNTQLRATFTAGADQLANFTNGSVTIEIFYLELVA